MTGRTPNKEQRRRSAFALAVLAIVCAFFLSVSGGERITPPTFNWLGYSQQNGESHGSVAISNKNAMAVRISAMELDGGAAEAFISGKPYAPPLHQAYFPPAIVYGRTNMIYRFPEPQSQSVTQVLFMWNISVRETNLKSHVSELWNGVKLRISQQFFTESSYTENPDEGDVVLEIPTPPHGTNSGPVVRAVRERVMF